jgi:hypothetical protein
MRAYLRETFGAGSAVDTSSAWYTFGLFDSCLIISKTPVTPSAIKMINSRIYLVLAAIPTGNPRFPRDPFELLLSIINRTGEFVKIF